MENGKDTLRLIYPQWQGGNISQWINDIPADDVSRGYFLGAQILNFLAPENNQKTIQIPISLDIENRKTKNGIISYDAILEQTKTALSIIKDEKPKKIITLGGECSVSVVPFTYMSSLYSDDIAVIWIDAHPDINVPGDNYTGYHAMALAACMGLWNDEITENLPSKIDPSKALIVGLREWDTGMKERQEELGIKSVSPEELKKDNTIVLDWLKNSGASKVMIHFDLDSLDPEDLFAGVVGVPNGIKVNEVINIINNINDNYDIVAFTIAEPLPKTAIKIKNMLNQLSILK